MSARVPPLPTPFFEASHQHFRALLREVLSAPLEDLQARFERGELSEDEAAREFVRRLAGEDLLRESVARSVRHLCVAREEISYLSGFADNQLALQGLGSHPIRLAGSDELVRRYADGAARGELLAAFALTEPGAGSDVQSMTSEARRDGEHYVLDGEKTLISNAGIADFYTVFARLAGSDGTVALVVDADTTGLEVTERYSVLAPHPIGRLRFRGCRVPASRRLGADGEGIKIAFRTLDRFRPSVGAAALGLATRALSEARGHVLERHQFGRALGRFQLLRAQLADHLADLELARLAVYRAAWLLDQEEESPHATPASSLAKLTATEACGRIVDGTVQLFGGRGVVQGELCERLFREARALRIYEGTSEIQRLILARELLEGSLVNGPEATHTDQKD